MVLGGTSGRRCPAQRKGRNFRPASSSVFGYSQASTPPLTAESVLLPPGKYGRNQGHPVRLSGAAATEIENLPPVGEALTSRLPSVLVEIAGAATAPPAMTSPVTSGGMYTTVGASPDRPEADRTNAPLPGS